MRLHPGMAKLYRAQIAALRETLAGEGRHGEAAALLRGAIERIDIVPARDGKALSANLYGHLAGILALASDGKAQVNGTAEWRAMVAGDRYGFIDLAPRPRLPDIPLIRKRS